MALLCFGEGGVGHEVVPAVSQRLVPNPVPCPCRCQHCDFCGPAHPPELGTVEVAAPLGDAQADEGDTLSHIKSRSKVFKHLPA